MVLELQRRVQGSPYQSKLNAKDFMKVDLPHFDGAGERPISDFIAVDV